MKDGALVTAASVLAILLTLTGYQATTATAAERLLGRLAASVVELDPWLAAHEEDLSVRARSDPSRELVFGDLPVRVSLPALSVVNADSRTLSDLLRAEMGSRLYGQGNDAFANQGGVRPPVTSTLYWGVIFLGPEAHVLWFIALGVSGMVLAMRSWASLRRGPVLWSAMLSGALASLAALALIWLLATGAASVVSGPVSHEFAVVVRDVAVLGLRNGIAFTVAIIVIAWVWRAGQSGQASDWRRAPGDRGAS